MQLAPHIKAQLGELNKYRCSHCRRAGPGDRVRKVVPAHTLHVTPCLSYPGMRTLSFPSSLWMAFPGLQCTQEIESMIVYVSEEKRDCIFFFF